MKLLYDKMGVDSDNSKFISLDLNGSENRRVQTPRSRPASSHSSVSSSNQGNQSASTGSCTPRDSNGIKVKKNVFFSNGVSSKANTNATEQQSPRNSSANGVIERKPSARSRAMTYSAASTSAIDSSVSSINRNSDAIHNSPLRGDPRVRRANSARAVAGSADAVTQRPQTSKNRPGTSHGQLRSRGSSDLKFTSADPRRRIRKRRDTDRSTTSSKGENKSLDSDDSDSDTTTTEASSSPRTSPSSTPLGQIPSAEAAALSEAQRQAWDQFETHVKTIDDSTELIARQPRKTFHASNAFQSVMYDLFGNTEYGKTRGFTKFSSKVGNVATFASRFIGRARALKSLRAEDTLDDDEFYEGEMAYQPSRETVENAKRGWKILRQYVQELAAEKRMSQTTLTWNMLRHTLKGLSNMERARYDLYRRYGIIPTVRSDGTVVQENTMLSDRARQALANRPSVGANPGRSRFVSSATVRRPSSSIKPPIDGFVGQMTLNRYTISR